MKLPLLQSLRDKVVPIKDWAIKQSGQAIDVVKEFQGTINKTTRELASKKAPKLVEAFDKSPAAVQSATPLLPWVILFVFILYIFDVFDHKPSPVRIQDPEVVYVNEDILNMVEIGEVAVRPFIEVVRVSGRVDFHESHLARIGANVTGRVTEMLALPGQVVKEGDLLAKITSTELTQSQLAYIKARNTSDLANRAAERAKILYKEDVIALAELQRRESEAANARAELRASQDQLLVQGMTRKSIDRLAQTGVIESINPVTATIPGEVVERQINRGQVVQPSDALFTIANLDHLWAIANIPETNAPLIKKGQKLQIQIVALNNAIIDGEVSFVSSIVNPETRTVKMRAEVNNKDRRLRPGMLATMLIESEPVPALTVPAEAVVRDGNYDHLFVRGEDNVFKMVTVKTGPESKGLRPIYSGIEAGQKIATKGAYHLNTERKKQLSGGSK